MFVQCETTVCETLSDRREERESNLSGVEVVIKPNLYILMRIRHLICSEYYRKKFYH